MSERARTITERVERVRSLLAEEGLDGVLVRSTDRYLNEYVPAEESTRVWLTGFTGSMGEAFVTREAAWVAVDGRYYLQADAEAEGTPFAVEKVPLGTSLSEAIAGLVRAQAEGGARRVGYEPDRYTPRALADLQRKLEGAEVELVPTQPSLIERARGPIPEPVAPVRAVPDEAVGRSTAEKVALARPALERADVQAVVVQRLDELAYLTNLRGDDFPFQATFRGVGLLLRDEVVLATDGARLPKGLTDAVQVVAPDAWADAVAPGSRVGYDPEGTTVAVLQALRARGAEPVELTSPLTAMKAQKTPAELSAMREAFRRADRCVEATIAFVAARLDAGERVTESDVAAEIERQFRAAGATGLSFRVIAAAGKNGAHIHYSHPDPERAIRPDELVLLDTGAYFAEGYATDLTRTFLAGSPALAPKASAEQRRIFTLVLRASIAGMSARLPQGSRGDQLDALTRAPIWAAGLNFNHGTGHGVGINVHEAPPRVSPQGRPPLEVGQVFSVEPGLYLPEFGGVRIENLCTVVEAPDAPGFLDVVPMTFAAMDHRLIDEDELSPREKAWLARYLKGEAAFA